MPTLFQQNGTFYLTVNYKGTRLRRSLGTSDLKIARKVAKAQRIPAINVFNWRG